MWFDHQPQCKNSGATIDTVVNIPREMDNLDDEQTRHSQNSVCFYLGHPDTPYPLGSAGIQKPGSSPWSSSHWSSWPEPPHPAIAGSAGLPGLEFAGAFQQWHWVLDPAGEPDFPFSPWLQTGLYLSPGLFRIFSSCLWLKLDTPMGLVSPASLHFSRAWGGRGGEG